MLNFDKLFPSAQYHGDNKQLPGIDQLDPCMTVGATSDRTSMVHCAGFYFLLTRVNRIEYSTKSYGKWLTNSVHLKFCTKRNIVRVRVSPEFPSKVNNGAVVMVITGTGRNNTEYVRMSRRKGVAE